MDTIKLDSSFLQPSHGRKEEIVAANRRDGRFRTSFCGFRKSETRLGRFVCAYNAPSQLLKPHLFPKLPFPLRDTLEMYSAEGKSITKILLSKMAKALKMKPGEIEEMFDDDMMQNMRMNYYPPCPQPDQVLCLTPHSDADGLTILLQLNEIEGLQIKKDGKWVRLKPLPDAFIVNVVDVLEIITNGISRSIEHRAVVNSEKERLSIASFHNPRLNKVIGPAKSLVERQKAAIFMRVTTKDYLHGIFSVNSTGKLISML